MKKDQRVKGRRAQKQEEETKAPAAQVEAVAQWKKWLIKIKLGIID